MSSKRVLYIGTPFFDYYKLIIQQFERKGYKVDFYNDRPSENSFVKGFIKIKKSLMDSLIQNYFETIMNETRNIEYDLVFVVNCKVFSPAMMQQLRDSQKSARFVLYMWDSLTLYPNSEELIPIFDKVYSFDTDDCQRLKEISFLPLFYSEAYEKVGKENSRKREYDIVSVCTAHPNRYKKMKALFPKLESKGVRIYSYMFLNILQYLYNKFFVTEFKKSKRKEFKFKPLAESDLLSILQKSNTVFDMPHSMQSGLTMRTIETFGAKRKLITTNINIKNYDFYDENNIFVMDEDNVEHIEEFLKRKYKPINEEIYAKYSLSSWVETIIKEEINDYLIC